MGLAGEEAFLVAGTLADNLLVGDPGATPAAVARALAAARLDAWVAGLPAGLDTPVGPGGAEVSGGERRRLSLARALLAGFPILIADEPTAGLDPEAAAAVVAALVATGEGHGLLLITHGAEGLEQMDEIVVLDRGRVVERGTHAEPARRRGPLRPLLGGAPGGRLPDGRAAMFGGPMDSDRQPGGRRRRRAHARLPPPGHRRGGPGRRPRRRGPPARRGGAPRRRRRPGGGRAG